jgi:hypothetical protein
MKPLRMALLIAALICFLLALYFEGIRSVAPGMASVPHPNFLSLGLAFWVLSEIVT